MKTKKEILYEQLDEIMDWLDFPRIVKAMNAVEWKWANEPEITEPVLRKHFRTLAQEMINNNESSASCGGFAVEVRECPGELGEDEIYLEGRFEMDQWEAEPQPKPKE